MNQDKIHGVTSRDMNNNQAFYSSNVDAPQHKENWQEQNLVINERVIREELTNHFTCDANRAAHVANWAYGIAEKSGSKYWLAAKDVFV